MYKKKYKWYPHIRLTPDQFHSVHHKLLMLYKRYSPMLRNKYEEQKHSKHPAALWVFQNYMMLQTMNPRCLPQCLNEWVKNIPHVVSVVQVVVDNCTLCIVEHRDLSMSHSRQLSYSQHNHTHQEA